MFYLNRALYLLLKASISGERAVRTNVIGFRIGNGAGTCWPILGYARNSDLALCIIADLITILFWCTQPFLINILIS